MKKEVVSSPIRWAGSKKKLLNEMLTAFDKESKTYIEPFLGSGVVLLNLINNIDEFKFENLYVNDINSSVINFYKILQNKPSFVIASIDELINNYNNLENIDKKSEYYYNLRSEFNEIEDADKRAIYFLFLMKAGFNGVYRENKSGKFNVPFGKKDKLYLQKEHLMDVSYKIRKVKFYNMDYIDFLKTLDKKGLLKNTFVYFDPPYIPEDNSINQKQELYTKNKFEHEAFCKIVLKYDEIRFLISMSDSKTSESIYGKYFMKNKLAEIIRTINPNKKSISKEVAFTNYKIDDNQ